MKTRVIMDFDEILQPDISHGWVVGLASENRSYVVEVTPLSDPSSGGAHVVSRVQPEFDDVNWNDVLRVQLLASTTPVEANIRVYALKKPRH